MMIITKLGGISGARIPFVTSSIRWISLWPGFYNSLSFYMLAKKFTEVYLPARVTCYVSHTTTGRINLLCQDVG